MKVLPTDTRQLVRDILNADTPPLRTAASTSVGLAIALSPFVGIHTILAILSAFAFRLNRLATVAATLAFNPWSAVPIVAVELELGALLLGVPMPPLPDAASGLSGVVDTVFPYLRIYVAGALVSALAVGVVSFPLLWWLLRAVRRR